MNFKNHISIFLAFFLLISNLGLAINVHYCGGKVADVTINRATNFIEIEKNCCGKLEKKSKCCDTKLIKSQEKSDQLVLKTISNLTEFVITDQWNFIVFSKEIMFHYNVVSAYSFNANAPPLYLLHSQHTFYE